MNEKHISILTMVLAATLWQSTSANQPVLDPKFDLGYASAKKFEKRPEGLRWERRFAADVGSEMATQMKECVARSENGTEKNFIVLMKLQESGLVSEVLLKPESQLSTCFSQMFKDRKLPSPPFDGYWVQLSLTVK